MWMDHQANSSAARKQMSWRALLPDIQRHRQNDGLKNGLCEPRPVLQRAKASSDHNCLLTSASSEGDGGRASVASVSERARASEGVSSFCLEKRGVVAKTRTSRMVVSGFSTALSMGRRPKAIGPISSETTIRDHPVLETTPDLPTNHTYAKKCNTFSEHHSPEPTRNVLNRRWLTGCRSIALNTRTEVW